MKGATLPGVGKRPAQAVGQPKALRRERQQRSPRTRRQARPVRDHIHPNERRKLIANLVSTHFTSLQAAEEETPKGGLKSDVTTAGATGVGAGLYTSRDRDPS